MNYRIKNGWLLLRDENGWHLKQEELFVKGTSIEAIGKGASNDGETYEEIDAGDQLIMPGLINSHTHVYMSFMKNAADDLPLHRWLNDRIFPIEAKMQPDDFYWTTLLGCMEMIQTGTTGYLDMHICADACAKAASDSGMRAWIGRCITGTDLYDDGYQSFQEAIREQETYESDLLNFVLSPHSVYACSPNLLSQIREEAQKRNFLKHIHLSESQKEIADCLAQHGKTPVALLRDIGFLDHKTIAAHCAAVNEEDILVLREQGVHVAINTASNAKLGNGIAPVKRMLEQGVNVCLATDGSASNNTLNMFREISLFSLLQKAANQTATGFSASDVLDCATVHPAKAFCMENKTGVISQGACADLIFIDLHAPSLFPNNNVVSSLCYSANGSEVNSVMINGTFVMRNKVFTGIDTERVCYEVKRIAEKYI